MTTEAAHPSGVHPRYKRVLLKLSGEAFGGGKVGLDPDVVREIAEQIAEAASTGVQIAVVMGGGNFFRGAELQRRGMDRARADYMGMLGIVMNCLALQDFLESAGIAVASVSLSRPSLDDVYLHFTGREFSSEDREG